MPDFTTLVDMKKAYQQRAIDLDLHVQVMGDGRLDSQIVIIGEGPGNQEVMGKMNFIGGAGNLLWNTLRQHKILRPQCYVTNVCKRQISLAKDKKEAIPADEWLKWQNLLHWELSQLHNPKYILAFGNAALAALHGWKGIGKYRGSVYDFEINDKPVQVLYTFNPAAVLRTPTDEIVFQFDARRFSQLSMGDWKPYPIDVVHSLSYQDSLKAIRDYRLAKLPTSYDIEWTSKALACVGFANDPHFATCINFRDGLSNRFTWQEEADIMLAIQELGEDRDIEKIAQNGNFDSHSLGYKDHINFECDYDTLLAHHTLYPSLPHGLGFLTSMYTTHPYYKDELGEWKETGDMDSFWTYNGKDCAITLAAKNGTEAELKQQGLYPFFKEHVMRLQPHLIQSTITGIPVDFEIRDKIAVEMEAKVKELLDRFHETVGIATGVVDFKPNPDSPKQMVKLLYGLLNLKHRSGSTDETARTDMMADVRTSAEAKEVLVSINKYKEAAKFYSTYVTASVDPDGRFRCDWKQHGVASAPGRLSSSKTLWGTGMNLQNQPPNARQFYVADDDCVLIYFDLSQAEARVVGYVADIDKWKEDFERARISGDFDCHRALAAEMFKKPYDEVPKSDRTDDDTEYTIRYIAKRCRHGLNYRMQIARLAETTGLSYSRAATSYHAYHKINPEIQKWWDATTHLVKTERQLVNAYGRRWKLLQRMDEEALKSIVAYYPQSTIGDKVCKVWYQSHEDDRWDSSKARIVINVHDALIGIAHKAYAKTALSIMKKYAEEPIMIQNVYRTKTEPLIIPADTAISTLEIKNKKGEIIKYDTKHRWSNLEKVKLDAAA